MVFSLLLVSRFELFALKFKNFRWADNKISFTFLVFSVLLVAVLNINCPNILFPYVREVISSMVERGGFPQLLLKPVNFEAVYLQYLEKHKQKATAP